MSVDAELNAKSQVRWLDAGFQWIASVQGQRTGSIRRLLHVVPPTVATAYCDDAGLKTALMVALQSWRRAGGACRRGGAPRCRAGRSPDSPARPCSPGN